MPVMAAEPGFTFAASFALIIAFAGVAVFFAIGALSHQHERAFSASVIYLGLGLVAAALVALLGARWVDPLDDASLLEHLTELTVVIALFSAGMKIERPLRPRAWGTVARLLLVAMPLTIAAVALWGSAVMGLSAGAAILLGAALAPTDPVLAGDLGIGPPGDEQQSGEARFGLTAEAGLNDGLAYPFVLIGLFVIREPDGGWVGEWLVADVLYAIGVAAIIGGAGGWFVAALAVRLRDAHLLARALDGWLAMAAVLLIYGVSETAGAYGFLAAFAGGLGFRRYEVAHEVNRRVHDGAELIEKFGELALILLLGSMVSLEALGTPELSGWLLVPLLLLVVRPFIVLLALVGSRARAPGERLFLGWFGVRGVGSMYYGAVIVGSGALAAREAERIFWVIAVCVLVSIVVHGITSGPLERRLLGPRTGAGAP